ncbi:hypothetical protein GCM10023319_20090 [Nocardia iowensis]
MDTPSHTSTARLLAAAAIIGTMTGMIGTGIAAARPESHDSQSAGSDSRSETSRIGAHPQRHVDPYGHHYPPTDQLDRAEIRDNVRAYHNRQQELRETTRERVERDSQGATWTRVVRPDGSWYVCRPHATQC